MKLRLNRQIFSKKEIEEAIFEYNEVTHITVLECREYWQCNFEECRLDQDIVIHEFENYIISLLNYRG